MKKIFAYLLLEPDGGTNWRNMNEGDEFFYVMDFYTG